MDNIAMAATYRIHATIFRMSAEVLLKDFESRGERLISNLRAIPFYYLTSHAIELLLKCALLKRNCEFGRTHDLEILLGKLIAVGIPVSDEAVNLVKILGKQHKGHVFRYTALLDDGQPTYTPEPRLILSVLDDLLIAGAISNYGR